MWDMHQSQGVMDTGEGVEKHRGGSIAEEGARHDGHGLDVHRQCLCRATAPMMLSRLEDAVATEGCDYEKKRDTCLLKCEDSSVVFRVSRKHPEAS